MWEANARVLSSCADAYRDSARESVESKSVDIVCAAILRESGVASATQSRRDCRAGVLSQWSVRRTEPCGSPCCLRERCNACPGVTVRNDHEKRGGSATVRAFAVTSLSSTVSSPDSSISNETGDVASLVISASDLA